MSSAAQLARCVRFGVDRRRIYLSIFLCLGVVGAGCIVVVSLPSRMGAGVFTTSDGRQYMVVSPCYPDTIQTISLRYRPKDARPGDGGDGVPVVVYNVDPEVSAAELFAPLDPTRTPVPDGLELVSVDDDLLAAALASTPNSTGSLGDYFYVKMTAVSADGAPDVMSGSWDATKSSRNTVVLHNSEISRADIRACGSNGVGWNVPPAEDTSTD